MFSFFEIQISLSVLFIHIKYETEIIPPLWHTIIFVQRLRSKPWTYKSKILSVFLFFFHSVSDF